MPADSMAHLLTAEELLRLDAAGKATELWRGRLLVREPPGTRHGSIAARLVYLLADHVYRNNLGVVCGSDPSRVEARTYRDDGGLTMVSSDGLLDASPVLPGFTCALAEVLR